MELLPMTVVELPYSWFEARISSLDLIREFSSWRAYFGLVHAAHLIVIDDFPRRRAIVFKYESRTDRNADVELVRRLREDGGDAASAPAWLIPIPPFRSASAANPLPEDSAA